MIVGVKAAQRLSIAGQSKWREWQMREEKKNQHSHAHRISIITVIIIIIKESETLILCIHLKLFTHWLFFSVFCVSITCFLTSSQSKYTNVRHTHTHNIAAQVHPFVCRAISIMLCTPEFFVIDTERKEEKNCVSLFICLLVTDH